ncbi:MAG: Gfo/Idh/MocA family oxidoreductase [Pirellulaceae bacterium]|nr:Gfo/Idh/MocA family oxidoreductase [Pirellulaceae bacterium]
MTPSLGVAVIGTGFIGPVHVEALRRAGQRVVGILGSTPEKSRQAAESLGIPRGYGSLAEVLADGEVQSVHITTPNRHHFEQAAAALRAGKHVLCEKPLAMTSRESAELVQIASGSGRAAGVAYNIRFYPLCHEAAHRVASGQTGPVLHVVGSYVQDWLLLKTDFNWRVLAEDGGELRAVADIGTHWLDLVQFITGQKVVAVSADLHTIHKVRERPQGGVLTFSGKGAPPQTTVPVPITTDDCGSITFRLAGGAPGLLWVSQATAGRKNCVRFEIAGAQAALAWNSEAPNELWIGHRDQPNESLIRDPALLSPAARGIANYPGGHNEGFPDSFKQLFRTFYGSIAAGDFTTSRAFPTFADGHHEILLCEAILQSHRERRWVEVAG